MEHNKQDNFRLIGGMQKNKDGVWWGDGVVFNAPVPTLN